MGSLSSTDEIILHTQLVPWKELSTVYEADSHPGSSPTWLLLSAWCLVVGRYTEADPIVCDIDNRTAHAIAIDRFEFSKMGQRRLAISLPGKTQVVDILEHPQQYLREVPEASSPHTAVLMDSNAGDGTAMGLLRHYDCSLILDDSLSPTMIYVVRRTSKGDLCAATAQQLASTFTQTIRQMLLHPNLLLQRLNLLTARDHALLAQWNPEAPRDAPDSSIVDVIWRHSVIQPDKVAIESWDGTLTYAEVQHAARRLAHLLREVGVGAEVMVPVLFDKSIGAIVAQIAILQAGGAFVPLDPAQPDQRLQGIVDQVRPPVALTAPSFAARLQPWVKRVIPVAVDALLPLPGDVPPPLPRISGDAMAYVLFTSGSTGKPKGCVVGHGALADVQTHAGPLRIRPDSRVLQFASYSFGVSLIEIYCTLSMGATACIPSEADRLNNLTEFIHEHDITWAFLTPSTALSIDPERVGPTLQTLVLAGEAMGRHHRSAWASRLELMQGYGLTEWAGICCVSPRVDDQSDLQVIGRSPAANIWLVDPADPHRLAPVGTVAELAIEGPSLAREYLHDPERTDAVFLNSPAWMSSLGRTKPSRLYRTGDLVQLQADGAIRYIARRDTQVKIRGKRLELGEVEYQIRRLWSGIERVVAEGVRPADAADSPMLAAFIFSPKHMPSTTEADDLPSIAASHFVTSPTDSFRSEVQAIRESLAAVLPEHMLPSVYLPLRHVPLTITGKVDRRVLREAAETLSRSQLDELQFVARVEVVLPRTAIEKTLHAAVGSILDQGPDQFGIHDSFLRLGGDSIKAMRLANRCKSAGLKITVATILREETVVKMAARVDDSQQEGVHSQQRQPTRLGPSQLEHLHRTYLARLGLGLDEVEECLPCTPIQEGILLSQARRAGLYLMRFVWDIRTQSSEPIDLSRLRWAWQRLSEVHPMLRTILLEGSGVFDTLALQVILKSSLPSPAVVWCQSEKDLDSIGLDETGVACGRPQLTLCPCGEGLGLVYGILYINHALVDAMSMSVLQRDLATLYDGDIGVPRGNYSAYTTHIRTLSRDISSLTFWKSYLAGLECCLFPLLNDRSDSQTRASGRLQRVDVDLGDPARFFRFSEGSGVTLASVFKLGWGCVLHAFTGSDTVCFGYMTAGRDVPVEDVEDLVGPFINMMVCRVDMDAQRPRSLAQMAAKVQAEFIQALPHQRVSMANITHGLHLAGEPLFNTTMTFPPQAADPTAATRSLSILEKERDDPTEYEIVVEVGVRGRDITATLKYWPSCLSEQQAVDVASTFSAVLSHIVEQPEQIFGKIPLLGESDKRKIAGWNGQAPQAVSRRVEDLIAEKCLQHPEKTAIDSWDGQLTYRELGRLASYLAQALEASGIGPEDVVPLCFAKCRWTSVAVLAVVKTGAAFALVDPSHPIERLQEICRCLNPKVVLCSREHTSLAALLAPRRLVVSDDETAWQGILQPEPGTHDNHSRPTLSPSQALYVVFTSGSTGKPKGVVMEHTSFCTAALAGSQALSLSCDSRVFQFSAYAFDVSVSDNLMPLLVGATICIPSDSDRRNRLAEVMHEMQVTWVTTTPSVARTLDPERLPSLTTLALGGEAMLPSDLAVWAGRVQLLNLYGPAECAVGVTVQPGIERDSNPAAIGWATDAAATWVVDQSSTAERLVPVGAIGELVIEGPLVARGYLNQAMTSSSPFLAPPAWLDHFRTMTRHTRLYRTGDLVRYHHDGSLRYVGRKDGQVKLRGQRIELGEVESRIKSLWRGPCEAVAEVVVPSGPDGNGRPMLAAFVCMSSFSEAGSVTEDSCQDEDVLDIGSQTASEFGPRVVEVTLSLEQTLPSYMVPTVFIPLRRVPLGKTGKTDRRLLRHLVNQVPREELQRLASPGTGRRPVRTPTEQTLQRLFAQVLAIPTSQISGDSHFFRIGGDSIVAMKLVALAREQGLCIAVADVFHHPQLSALAIQLDETKTEVSPARTSKSPVLPFSMVPESRLDAVRQAAVEQAHLPPNQIEDIYPCTALQEGMMALTAQTKDKYIAQLRYRIATGVQIGRLHDAWQRTVDANAILRTRIVVTDSNGSWQVVQTPAAINWRSEGSLEEYLLKDRSERMGPGEPLARCVVIEPPAGPKFFVLTIHHALYDGWTLALLLRQVEEAYHGQLLSPRPFAPFIRYLMDRDSSACETFWKSEFSGLEAPVFSSLAAGFQGRPDPSQVVERTVDLSDCLPSGATLSNTIRLAWAVVVSHYTDSDDVVFGVTVTGRSASLPGIADLTGPTIATHPFRVKINGSCTVSDALEDVQSRATRIIAHEQVGLQQLRKISAEAAAACDFQSHLGIQQPAEEEDPAGLLRPEHAVRNYAAFASYAWVLVCELPRHGTQEIKVMANFDPRALPAVQPTRLVNQFAHVLRQLCLSPQQALLRQIEVASPEDVQQLQLWNASVPTACPSTVHDLVLQHAMTPSRRDRQAVSSGDRCLTFGQLDSLSAEVAAALIHRGLRRGSMVPLCCEKSVWPVVAMMGVLRAGGAVVNIDPALPQDRIRTMLDDARPCILLASSATNASLLRQCAPSTAEVMTIPIDMKDPVVASRLPEVETTDAAFIIFTSGSTGKPKGIIMEHVNLATSIRDHASAMNMSQDTRALHFAAYAFDASIYEIFSTLVAGGCVCIPSETDRLSRLAAFIREHHVNWALLTPSAVSVLQATDVPSLKTLVLGGEALTHDNVETWRSRLTLINAYGPAEATICSAGRITAEEGAWRTGTIGPILGACGWVTVVDDPSRLAPLGAVGELLLEGPVVTREYLNRPEQTKAGFIDAPAWLRRLRPEGPGRLYRSRDLVELSEDGWIRFIGRKDTQVKLRGQRIELGEVERHLRAQWPDAREIVAEVMQRRVSLALTASSQLVAFVQPAKATETQQQQQQIDGSFLAPPTAVFSDRASKLRSQLQALLPPYMVPSVLFPLAHVPLSRSDKIDRRRLREEAGMWPTSLWESYAAQSTSLTSAKEKPQTDTERILQDLWATVLSISPESVGRQDNFFALGGESIAAMKLAGLASRRRLDLTVAQIFARPCLKDLAETTAATGSILDQGSLSQSDPLPFSLLAVDDDAAAMETIMVAAESQCRISRTEIEDIYPCTALQEGLMALTVKQPGAYSAILEYECPQNFDLDRYHKAWDRAARAHPILRTRIIQTESHGCLQVVLKAARIQCEDSVDPACFGLGVPLLQLGKCDDTPPAGRLVVCMHHSIYDGWSLPLLLAEVERGWAGQTLHPQRFSRLIAHQQQSREAAVDYWRNELAGTEDAAVAFPMVPSGSYTPRPDCTTRKTLSLEGFRVSAGQARWTVASRLRLSWALAVMQYTSNDDVVFGVTTSGRAAPISGIEGIIGPTIATTPARVRGLGQLTIAGALQRVQESSLEAMRHEHLGLQQIRGLTESTAAATRFQTLIVIQPEPTTSATLQTNSALFARQAQSSHQGTVNTYPLLLMCQVLPQSVAIEAVYDPRVLDRHQMERTLRQFEHIFMHLLSSSPAAQLKDLPVINAADAAQLVHWAGPSWTGAFEPPVHGLIEEHSSLQPDAEAVHAWDGRLTYRDLNSRASHLALLLRSHGVGPETFVPLLFEKSCFTVVAQLAVMKAGAAFVLLDASSPIPRLQSICTDIRATLILASATQQNKASSLCKAVIPVTADTAGPSLCSGVQVEYPRVQPSDAAYAVFTSGSTGQPKGVVINHASLAHSVNTHVPLLKLNPASRVLQFAGYAFDIAIMDHISTLVAGGCICVPSDDDRRDNLAAATREFGVNWACLTSSVIRTLTPLEVPTIRTLVQAGEPMAEDIVDTWASSTSLINAYGPAECTILSSIQNQIDSLTDPRDIGHPCGGRAWILDPEDPTRLLPIGAVGELVLEGPLVARGYLNDPARMAVSFVERMPAWWTEIQARVGNTCDASSRLYRTGDLVRYGPDGRLLYHGRRDRQVKLRGQRMELADIEHQIRACFTSHGQIRDVVVELISPGERAPFLAAFSASQTPADGTSKKEILLVDHSTSVRRMIHELDRALEDLLPTYMIPSVHLAVSHIPLGKSGKADRQRLRQLAISLASEDHQLDHSNADGESMLAKPTTDLEVRLQAIWARVLNVPPERIGVLDNFFRVGGDSISAMQVATQCSSAGMAVRAADLFKFKNIAELAAYLSAQACSMKQIKAFNDECGHWVPLSPVQQFFFDLSPEGHSHFNQSFFLRFQRPTHRDAIQRAVDHIVRNHPMLRARFRRGSDRQWMQTVLRENDGNFLFNDHAVPDRDAMTRIAAASQRSLDFEHGPVLAVDFMQASSTGQQYLFIAAHHLVIDLVSWRVILADLEDLLLRDKQPMSEAITFLSWCRSQEAYAATDLPPSAAFPVSDLGKIVEDENATDYWQLGDKPNTFGEVDTLDLKLDQVTTDSILGPANDALRTQPVEVIQAALLHAFVATFANRPAPLIFTEGHGRESWDPELDLSRTVGWFTSIWPTAVDILPTHSLIDTICRTKDARRRVPANGWAYFTSRFLHPEGRKVLGGRRRPMEILFNYLGRYQQLERSDSLLVLEEPLGREAGDIDDRVSRFALIDISAYVSNGCLSFKFLINRHMQHQNRIKQWVVCCKATLEEAATALISLQPRLTLADCSLMEGLSYQRVNELSTRILPDLGVSAADIVQVYPCAPVQRGILLAQARNPALYQTRLSWRITSADPSLHININAVKNAWLRLIARHDMLRTIFIDSTGDGLMDQVVLADAPAAICLLHRNGDLIEEPETRLDLDPLHRVTLSERPEEGSVQFQLDINHALIDGASLGIIKHELALAYADRLPAAAAASSYQSYIQYLQSKESRPTQEYWQNYLRGREPCLFPALHGLDARETHEERVYTVGLGLKRELARFCDEQGISISVICHLAWALVLRDYTGQESVSFGFLTSARDVPVPGIEHAVGPLINVLVGSMSVRGNQSVSTALANHQQQFLASLEHQHHPVADIHLGPGLSGAGLFNTLISVQIDHSLSERAESNSRRLPHIEQVGGNDPTEYPITVSIGVTEEDIGVSLAYWTSFLSDEQAHSLTYAFRQALAEVLAHPSHALGAISLVSPEDHTQLCRWNKEIAVVNVSACVHDLILQRSNDRPSALAICAWDGTMTYEDLDRLSSRVAIQLHRQASNIGPGTFIPLCFEKSMWTVVAILAVLKTGSAFVLLDPSQPLPRLQHICKDVQAPIVLAGHSALHIAGSLGPPVLVLSPETADGSAGGEAPSTTTLFSPDLTPDSAAYVIFTSGSTGMPKGVVISHESFCSAANAHVDGFGLSSSSRILQFSSYAFDACLMDMLTALIAGGCVCIPSEEDRRDRLGQAMMALQVNWACLTPSVARVLSPEDVPCLQTLLLGGEAALPSDIAMWSHLNLLVVYGPAECAVACMLQPSPTKVSHSSNIGFGLGALPWIVDPADQNRLLPIGAVGELVMEGPLVGRGYLENPEQTAKSFIASPGWRFSFQSKINVKPARMYKTGDLVQYTADGSIRFMGRKDSQVKVRGQRIELGEVEAQVGACFSDFVQVAVDLVQVKDASYGCLLGFVTTERQDQDNNNTDTADDSLPILPPTDAHRAAVAKGLTLLTHAVPSYMIPIAFLPLQYLPLSKSGKLDRKRLRNTAALLTRDEVQQYNPKNSKASRATTTTTRTATVSKAEDVLLQSCAAVLNLPVDGVGMDDDFFVLGGDSVSAMKLVAVLAKRGYQLSVKDIFNYSRLADLVLHVANTDAKATSPIAVQLFSVLPPGMRHDDAVQLVSQACQVEPSIIEDVYPCTALQEGLISLTAKKAGTYVAQFQYDLPQDVDLARLREAWGATSAANPILRTRIVPTGQHGFLQAVIRQELPWQTFASLESYDRERQQSTFGPGTSLVRLAVLEQHDGSSCVRNQLMLEIHHALYDGWSLPLLLTQVAEAYRGETLRSVPFSPFIQHVQRSATSAKRFWRRELSGTAGKAFPALPSEGHEPCPSCTLSLRLAYPGSKQADSITLTTRLRLAWAILSARYTLSDKVVFGVTVNGRAAPVPGIETMTGPTLATVPFRVALDRQSTIDDNLRQLQQRSVAMFGLEQIGLQNIARLGSEAAGACRFQTLLVVQQERKTASTTEPSSGRGLFGVCRELSEQGTFATYPLLLDCHPLDDGILVHVQYDANILPEAQMRRILSQLEHILAELSERPNERIADIGLGADDWSTLSRWNATPPPAVNACVHHLIEQKCREQPDAPAVCAWDGEFSYRELDQLSSRLARVLVGHGVEPESFVPVYLDKSRWVPVSLLAILKAGAAYMLLDTTHPLQRLHDMCQQVDARFVLTTIHQRAAASQLASRTVEIEEHGVPEPSTSIESGLLPLPICHPSSAAYVIFTSGSTGKPKGAIVEHRNLASSMHAHAAAMDLTASSRVFQFASHAFDATMAEVMTTLLVGGCVCIPSEEERTNDIAGAVARMQVNWAFLTPTVAQMLQPEQVPSLKTLVIGGEALRPADFSRWQDSVNLVGAYGPSECTIFCAAASSEHLLTNSRQLGRPLGSCAWVVDPENSEKLVPVGAIGELLIEGPIVCRGYLKQLERTAAVFIDPPQWLKTLRLIHREDIRLYRTGDLVQYAPDGTLLFVGRKDNQVKIRGQRIELGEIEAQVQQSFRRARQVIVEIIPAGGNHKNPFICAFIWQSLLDSGNPNPKDLFLPQSEQFRTDIADAESHLRERLPQYMVPGIFLPLASPPVTKNGKADRKLLVEKTVSLSRTTLNGYRIATVVSKRAPTTATERQVHQLVAVVLNLDPNDIGMEEDFFRIGGDSITAMMLVGAARQAGLTLSVPDIFNHPRLIDLAHIVQEESSATAGIHAMDVPPGSLVGLSDYSSQMTYQETVDRLASHYGLQAEDIIDILPTTQFQRDYLLRKESNYFVLDIPGPVVVDRIHSAVDAVMRKYSALRTVFVPLRDTLVQVPLRLRANRPVRHFSTSKSQLASYAEQLARADSLVCVPYGALHFQATLVSADDDNHHFLVLRLSHAQYDGFSLARLYRDLSAAYSGRTLASAPDYTTYMVHRHRHITTSPLLDFWREYLAGSSVTKLRPVQDSKQPETAIHLHQEVRVPALPDGITIATLYKAAWALVLARHTHTADLVFGQVVNGRSLPLDGIEEILGACVHVVPVRVQIHGSWRVRDLLQHVQADHIRALPYETVDMDELVARCTDWSPLTRLETVAQHQNVPVNPGFRFAGVNCTTFGYEFNYMPRELYVISVPREQGVLSIDLSASSRMVDDETAALLLDGLCEMVVRLAEDPDAMVTGLM